MSLNEAFDKEIRRLQYLEAMGIDSYVPRQVLPGAFPSVIFDWPEVIVETLPQVSDTAIADKNALQKLQQDLGMSQRKLPAASKAANVAMSIIEPSTTAALRNVLQFQLAIFQPIPALLVLVPAQHTNAVHFQLLKNILLAIAVKTDHLAPIDNFNWPPRVTGAVKVHHALEAAQETLHALLEGYQKNKGIKNILIFAGDLADKLFPIEAAQDQTLPSLNVLLLPDFQQMLDDGVHKKITWQKIRSLTL